MTLGFLITISSNGIATASGACGDPATPISAVQGNGPVAALNGSTVTIEGIVVGDYQGTSNRDSLRGYFVQEDDAEQDGDPATSEGVFVFDSDALPDVSVGQKVRVTGTVSEYFGMTQVSASSELTCAGTHSVTPTPITLPVPGVPTGDLAAATAAIDAYYEAFEGMLVTFPDTLTVSEYFQLERFGQLVLSQGGRITTFTAASPPSASGLVAHQVDLARRKVILDDDNNWQNSALENGTGLPYPSPGLSTTNRFRGGDTIDNLTGVLHWSWAGFSGTDAWRIRPVAEQFSYTFTPANPRPAAAPAVSGTLKVASFNVLNYFTTIDLTASRDTGDCGPSGTLDCRGPDSAAELVRQTDKVAIALCGMDADIVGLMEIENNASASLSALVNAANSAGCGPYAYVDTGLIGTDAIKVGFLYKTTTVATQGAHQVLDSSIDPNFVDTKNRPMLAQTFRELSTDALLTVAVNHLKSKGSPCDDLGDFDQGDGQGNCNGTRTAAAQAIVDWLATDPTGSGDADFLVIGDLNAYRFEDPISAIRNGPDDTPGTADDYTNLLATFAGPSAYSYVFDGQTGYLDHALASPTLLPQVTGAANWHINADEPPSFDYNDDIKDDGERDFEARPSALPLYAVNEFRTSDHDPLIVGLSLAPPDTDGDGLPDAQEPGVCPSANDADSDDDGIADGVEDANGNGVVDPGETNPCLADSDNDGLPDGTESGITAGVADPDGDGPLLGTDTAQFVPDADPLTTTLPTERDSDGDGISDGAEDANRNGRVDAGETDPDLPDAGPTHKQVPAMGLGFTLLLAGLLVVLGVVRRTHQH